MKKLDEWIEEVDKRCKVAGTPDIIRDTVWEQLPKALAVIKELYGTTAFVEHAAEEPNIKARAKAGLLNVETILETE